MANIEKIYNESIQTNQAMTLMTIENDVMRERLGRLYNSLQFMGEIKNLQD